MKLWSLVVAFVVTSIAVAACTNQVTAHSDALTEQTCGDGHCAFDESCSTCAPDCGFCADCGDGTCTGDENCGNCTVDYLSCIGQYCDVEISACAAAEC